jgi:predicted RNA polymerase sigma factor
MARSSAYRARHHLNHSRPSHGPRAHLHCAKRARRPWTARLDGAERLANAARTDSAGEPILMLGQSRVHWDQFQIRRGMQALQRARELGGAGSFHALQAAIIACHAEARTANDTDWSRIAGLYAELAAVVSSPIIELNHAVAVGMAEGPEAGLLIVDRLMRDPALKGYHLLPSVRGDCPAEC